MDNIKIGLDFGTHQTKICVQRIPDEGHGEPNYEYFQFADLQGNMNYFLPSVVQINNDDTLSYGYVDRSKAKVESGKPQKPEVKLEPEFNVSILSKELYDKYATQANMPEDKEFLTEMLEIRLRRLKERNNLNQQQAESNYALQLKNYNNTKNVFRYFKQATFIGSDWSKTSLISSRTLCVWYLAYVIFLLEREYGENFSINMGVPTDETSYDAKKRVAVEILASAYNLVENVYKNDLESFLSEKYTDLKKKTEDIRFSKDVKYDYNINIFPEAYASLLALTSRRKLPEGHMNLTADVGGGTTDISFFTIEEHLPMIYKYWSIPRGLNYVAERSGFDYADGDFEKMVKQDVIDKYNRKKIELIYNLVKDLRKKIHEETAIPVKNLNDALENRVLVYSGGGSTFDFMTEPILTFTDVRVIDESIWNEENVKDKDVVSDLSVLLTTAYGLSIAKEDKDVVLKNYEILFDHLPKTQEETVSQITKDQC